MQPPNASFQGAAVNRRRRRQYIRRPLAGVSDVGQTDSGDSCYADRPRPFRFTAHSRHQNGHYGSIKIGVPLFSGPGPVGKRPFFSFFFWTLIFGRFGSLFQRSGLILETSASQKPMFSLGKTMICTFAPFPLPARFFHRKCPKRCKKEPKNRVISISIFRVPLFFGPEAVGKRHRSLPGALSEDLGPPGRPLGLLSEASGPHF